MTTGPRITIRVARTDAELAAIAAITTAVTPDDPLTLEEMRWAEATYPGGTRLAADLDGRLVGAGSAGRIYMYPPEFPAFWAAFEVLPDARRQGVGTALLTAISERARAAGKTELHAPVSEARPEGIDFLVHRGFTELERAKMVRLELAGLQPPAVRPPAGVQLATLLERPDLVPGIHAVAVEAFADIPGTEPMAAGDLAEFRARDVDRPSIPPGAFQVAIDAATGQVIGYASLLFLPGSTTVAWHDMTAVARAWRGRGVAAALKHATIRWAITNGLVALETGNDEENAPMRGVNARLGYRPLPDRLTMRGPLFGGMMEG